MQQRRQRHERPGFIKDGSVLATVNPASRRLWRWPSARVDRPCARRFWEGRPGRRNAVQPNKETFRSALRRKRRSTRRFSGRITPAFPKRSSLPGRWIGSGRISARWCLAQARQPRHMRLDRPLPFLTPSGGSPALTPYRSMTPGSGYGAKKGLTAEGPAESSSMQEKGKRPWYPEPAHSCRSI